MDPLAEALPIERWRGREYQQIWNRLRPLTDSDELAWDLLAEILRQVQLRRWEGVEMYGGGLSGAGCGAAGLQISGGAPEGTAGAHAV